MSETSYDCHCGEEIRYRQDLTVSPTTTGREFSCRVCGSSVPGMVGERVRGQHPS